MHDQQMNGHEQYSIWIDGSNLNIPFTTWKEHDKTENYFLTEMVSFFTLYIHRST